MSAPGPEPLTMTAEQERHDRKWIIELHGLGEDYTSHASLAAERSFREIDALRTALTESKLANGRLASANVEAFQRLRDELAEARTALAAATAEREADTKRLNELARLSVKPIEVESWVIDGKHSTCFNQWATEYNRPDYPTSFRAALDKFIVESASAAPAARGE